MAISDELIQQIKDQNDIVDVISESVRLKKAGRNYIGLCPFHNEKSPSFSVSTQKQIYKCFGCGEAGNVITFIMKNKNFNFIEALEYLANRVNIEFIQTDEDKQNKNEKDLLYKLNIDAAKFFFQNLKANKKANEYFLGRGITQNTINKFGLGYSLDSWRSLLNYLKNKGYKEKDIEVNGLIIKSEKGNYYDRFRNRVMFPVFDYRGKVIGFGGRVLEDTKPKYLNSPEGPIFSKGIHLYGLNFAIKKDNESRTLIIVEGYMDCIALHQYGITNAVASLGTALTLQQAKLLKRYADKVIISYDADLAGQMATLRGLDILRKVGLDVRVLTVPKGKDPDEFIRSNGVDAFQKLINEALPLIDYRLKKAKDGIDFNQSSMLIKYAKRVTEILAELNPIEKDVYVKKISEDTGIREQAVYDLLGNELTKNFSEGNEMNNMEINGHKLYIEPAYMKAERALLKIMSSRDEYLEIIVNNIESSGFIVEAHKKIYELILKAKEEQVQNITEYIETHCNDVETSKEYVLIQEINFEESNVDYSKLLTDYIFQIKKHTLEEKKKLIMQKLKECEIKGLFEESLDYVKDLKIIDENLKGLERS
ncbi:DNA primase [Clostridium amylolyticum]|uniref:DNA primase n=1 Tax=Clostridium amylolyticum TaxID=1121298 RepID=A0A1M6CR20_9CLOT|nr:DNA primase [Clostridium amylolyticum]SHI63178.1 DNA primase [Clostridium amylolyticum]